MVKAILFDMDGVLIDSQPLHYKGDQQTLANHGVTASVDEMTAYAGTTNQLRFELFKERYGLSQPADQLIAEREALMIQLVKESSYAPVLGIPALLQSIHEKGLLTAVASSSSYSFIYAVLDQLGLRADFNLVYSGESCKHGKPAPDVFLETCEKLGVTPEECVVIEDSMNGVAAAVNAGMRCLGYQNPTSGEQDLSKATVVVDDFRKVRADDLMEL